MRESASCISQGRASDNMTTWSSLLAWVIFVGLCLPGRSTNVRKGIAAPASAVAASLRAGGSASSAGGYQETGWIQDFCRKPGNEFFAEVPESFIRESMNSIDIGRGVDIPYRQEALGVILGERRLNVGIHGDQEGSIVQSSAALLYGLLHARFLVSPQGLKVVLEKFSKADFGRCPRVYCQGQAVLPVGETDRPMQSSVRVYCPRCGELYFPSGYVRACDGAFWGTTLPHLLLLGWPELKTLPNTLKYVPRVFGFKVYDGESVVDAEGAAVKDAAGGVSPEQGYL